MAESMSAEGPLANEIPPSQLVTMGPKRLSVRVEAIRFQGEDLNEYELVDPEGGELPPFSAGSHIDLYFRDGRVRQYSLCNPDNERHRYKIVVQREPAGRGGSKAIFERIHVGRILVISHPRNNFALQPAGRYILIAGGIGITPLLSMAYSLQREGKEFTLHYCTRTPAKTAFLRELRPFLARGDAIIHHDGGDPTKGLDLHALLRTPQPDTHVFYCGPPGFMRAVASASDAWPNSSVHFEFFTPPARPEPANDPLATGDGTVQGDIPVGFEVRIARTGQAFEVPNDKSILQVLRENGFDVPSSCESGLCGTCKVRYVAGTPDHRDYILEDTDKEHQILVCCSRAKSRTLTLDL